MSNTATTATDTAKAGKLSLRERICYGFGDLGCNIGYAGVGSFIMYYYTNAAGISAATAGMILMLAKLFDGVSDLGVGILVDRTHTRWGKARPWVLFGAIPFVVVLVMAFSVPDISQTGKVVYAFITYTLLSAGCYTAINIPYGSMTALMTQNPYERGVLSVFRMTFAAVGSLLVSSMTLTLIEKFGNDKAAWSKTYLVFGVIALAFLLLCFAGTKERVKPSGADKDSAATPTLTSIKALFKNKYWFLMLAFQFVNMLIMALNNNGIYFFQYSMGNRDLYSVSMVLSMVCMMLGIIVLASPLIKRIGKRNTSLVGIVLMLAGAVIMSAAMHLSSAILVQIGIAVKGAGSGVATSTLTAMLADTVEYGEYKTGIRSEGLTYSASTFGGKVGSAVGSAIVGFILSAGGFVEGADVQSASAVASIDTMYLYLPILLCVLDIVILAAYKLDKEYPSIMEELNRRKADTKD